MLGEIKIRQKVIAFSGSYGSGVSTYVEAFRSYLDNLDNVIPVKIKVSELLLEYYKKKSQVPFKLGTSIPKNIAKKKEFLQNLGNSFREKEIHSISYFILLAILSERAKFVEQIIKGEIDNDPMVVFLIDSIKNPADIEPFRNIYEVNNIFMIGVVASKSERIKRLKTKFQGNELKELELDKIDDIDYGQAEKYQQKTRDVIDISDFYISNNNPSKEKHEQTVDRILRVLFRDDFIKPTIQENAMFAAWSASLMSSCLSRQVGAAITDKEGNVISVGYNDVPKCGGGYYDEACSNNSSCYFWSDSCCHNSRIKTNIFKELADKISVEMKKQTKIKIESDKIFDIISRDKDLKGLLEYSRSVHAEMSAIINLSRDNIKIPQGAKLYVTTYPCHHCARHIVYAGVTEVFFIEAYPKSRTNELHHDSISDCSKFEKVADKVNFMFYKGIAPKNYFLFFNQFRERKNKKGAAIKKNLASLAKTDNGEQFITSEDKEKLDEKGKRFSTITQKESEQFEPIYKKIIEIFGWKE